MMYLKDDEIVRGRPSLQVLGDMRVLRVLGCLCTSWIIALLLIQNIWGSSILQVPNSQVSRDSCQGLTDGIHADFEQACRLFFACSGGRRLATFWCVRGYVFSSSTGKCEPPDRATCGTSTNPGPTEECPLGDGIFPDYESRCAQFDFCKNGKKMKFPCPTSMVFDWRTESCQSSNQVSCQPMECNGQSNGKYPDRDNECKRYVNCTSGNATMYTCPYGQSFNTRLNNCSTRTSCQSSMKSSCLGMPDGYYPDYNRSCRTFEMCMSGHSKVFNCPANTSFNLNTLTCDEISRCRRPEKNKCRGKQNGIYPELTSECRRFYACIDGSLVKSGSCPLGKALNQETFVCESPSSTSCASKVSGQCSNLEDGLHPDYSTGCSGYFLCRNGRKIASNYCIGENLFDVATSSCLPASYVSCARSAGHSFAPRLLHSYDCNGRVGLFPEYSSQCKQFVVCAYGKQTLFECPNGTYYNAETSSCQKDKVSCVPPSVISIFQCLPSDEGIYVGSSCDHWNECRKGVGFTIACPAGHTFNIAYSKCLENRAKDCHSSSMVRKPVSGVAQFNVFEDENLVFDCYDKPNGVYQSQNCRVFHICAEGSLSSFYCPSAMTFDFESQQCQPLKQNTTCDVESSLSPKVRSNECDGVGDGMYADYDLDCRRYFVCESGRAILVYCPERQKFSSVKMICDQEDRVNCLPTSEVTINATKIDFEGLIYHVEVAKEEDTTADLPINTNYRNRFMRNGTVEPNSIRNKATTNKRNHNLKDSTSPPFDDDNNYTFTISNRSSVVISQTPCPDGDTGFFPDYNSDCRQFHICFRSIRKTYSCPSVLRFNPETKNCDLPENVVCSPPISANSTEFDCKILENQFVPDYSTGCKQFVGCTNNVPYRFSCPAGKLFNPSSRTCDVSEAVNCIPASVREDPSKEPSFRHSHGFRRNVFDCSRKADGFYADFNRHCHVFYRCVRGKKFSHYCKQGLLFNPESGICDFEENVVCSNSTESNL